MLGITPQNLGIAPAVQAFAAQMGLTFPVVWDTPASYGEWGGGFAPSGYPLDIVVDRTGHVTYVAREYEALELRAAVESAL